MSSGNGLTKYYIGILLTLLRGRQNITEIWEWSRPNLHLSNKETISNKIEEMAKEGLVAVEETLPKTIKGKKRRTKKGKVLEKNVELTGHGRNLAKLYLSIEQFTKNYIEFVKAINENLNLHKLLGPILDESYNNSDKKIVSAFSIEIDDNLRKKKFKIYDKLRRKGFTNDEISLLYQEINGTIGLPWGIQSAITDFPAKLSSFLLVRYKILRDNYQGKLYKDILQKIVFDGIEKLNEFYLLPNVDEVEIEDSYKEIIKSNSDCLTCDMIKTFEIHMHTGLCSFSSLNDSISKVLYSMLGITDASPSIVQKYLEIFLKEKERLSKIANSPKEIERTFREYDLYQDEIDMFYEEKYPDKFDQYIKEMYWNFTDYLRKRHTKLYEESKIKYKQELEALNKDFVSNFPECRPSTDYLNLYEILKNYKGV